MPGLLRGIARTVRSASGKSSVRTIAATTAPAMGQRASPTTASSARAVTSCANRNQLGLSSLGFPHGGRNPASVVHVWAPIST